MRSHLGEFVSLKHLLHEQRLIKSDAEIQLMQKAGTLALGAHQSNAMLHSQLTEGQRSRAVVRVHAQRCSASAYPSIIGSASNNGCVLHYTNNDAPLQDGNLVLIDAGVNTSITPQTLPAPFQFQACFRRRKGRCTT
ncbi:MAG: hypothetical protein CM15mP120_07010 [Pseudomonadota bacterium]|nr:MAG: hypothetical protein CM15mP120_07010 [Pseudomonadota bacterium]